MQHGYLEEDRYPIREVSYSIVSHPTNEHECLTDVDSNIMPLYFDGDYSKDFD